MFTPKTPESPYSLERIPVYRSFTVSVLNLGTDRLRSRTGEIVIRLDGNTLDKGHVPSYVPYRCNQEGTPIFCRTPELEVGTALRRPLGRMLPFDESSVLPGLRSRGLTRLGSRETGVL